MREGRKLREAEGKDQWTGYKGVEREEGERERGRRDGPDETERERCIARGRRKHWIEKKRIDDKDGINKPKTHRRRTEDVNACVLYGGVRLISSATRRWADGSPVRASLRREMTRLALMIPGENNET